MRKLSWIILFIIIFLADLIVVYVGNETLRFITKPLLVPLLVGYFFSATTSFRSSLKKWVVFALVFSWMGDVLLMFESANTIFFIFGLIAFLIAHIFYILLYENIIGLENIKKNYWLFIPVLIYYLLLIYILSPHLENMKWPVRVYGVVISYMLVQALQIGRINNRTAATIMIPGAVLFILSDSILAMNKFYQSFEQAGIAIMLTYGIAQLLITVGAAGYITSASKG
ncbi:MAG TPA: lysoplasmalogenase [Chitinophagaceae bacterium]|nr:lysoplasmalogenase [Chitinophagaceae bacterium]